MAATTVNLLGLNEALSSKDSSGDFQDTNQYITEWRVASLNASYEIADTKELGLAPSYYSLNVSPSDFDPVVIELDNQRVLGTQAFNCNLAFSANLLSDQDVTIKTEICQDSDSFGAVSLPNPDPTTGNIYTILVKEYPNYISTKESLNIPGQWTAFRSNYYPIVENRSALNTSTYDMKIRITIYGHNSKPFQITTCALIDDTAFYLNRYVQTGQSYIPTFYWDLDAKETNPTYPYYKLLDILTSEGNYALSRYKDWFDYELGELQAENDGTEQWTRSTLTDPTYVGSGLSTAKQREVRTWLAQFVGAPLKYNVWATGINTNAAGGTPNSQFESWLTDEGAYLAWQLQNGYYGLHGGTRDAVINSVRQVLSGDKEVAIYPNAALNSGTALAGSSTSITLASDASAVDDYYNGSQITLTGGTGQSTTIVDITDYVGSTKVATVASWPSGTPSTDTTYSVTNHWHLLIQTVTSQTPDADTTGDTSAPVMDAVELAKPMGYFYTHAVVLALYLTLDNMGIGRLDGNKLG